jgi:hypothetical protein
MSSTLTAIALRVSPPVVWGRDLPRTSTRATIYNGTLIPYFLMENGGEPLDCRGFLTANRLGSAFDALYPGMEVKVKQIDSFGEFSRHPEA